MQNLRKRASIVGLLGNIALFILKLIVGLISNSIAIISDAFNSLTDIINSVVLYISVKVGSRSADKGHPFGHYRSEPLGGFIVAILTIVLGVEITRVAVGRLVTKAAPIFSILILIIVIGTILVKSALYFYTKAAYNKTKSAALFAFMIDHRNDVIVSFGALIGFAGVYFNYAFLDSLAAIFIGIWIIKSGVSIGTKNTKYLMGAAPNKSLIDKISKVILKFKEVKNIQKIKAHYVGTLLQVETHVRVDKNMSLHKAHDIEIKIRNTVQSLNEVDRAFIHLDPIIKSRPH